MKRGYTLIETVVYVALVGFLATVLVGLLLVVSRSFIEFRSVARLSQSGAFAMERLVREIRQATGVDLAQSQLGVNPGRLVLNTTDSAGQPTTATFFVQNSALLYQPAAGVAASTTSQFLQVSNLVFRRLASAKSQAVKVELTLLRPAGSLPARSENFYTTAVLRGSY